MMSIKTLQSFKYRFVFATFLHLLIAVSSNGYAQTKYQDSLKIIKLDTVIIRDKNFPFINPLPAVKGTYIFSGRKSETIELEKMDINRVDNNARQLFSKSPGIFVYETDGSGNQVNISTRD